MDWVRWEWSDCKAIQSYWDLYVYWNHSLSVIFCAAISAESMWRPLRVLLQELDDNGTIHFLQFTSKCRNIPRLHPNSRYHGLQEITWKQKSFQVRCARLLRNRHRMVLVPIRTNQPLRDRHLYYRKNRKKYGNNGLLYSRHHYLRTINPILTYVTI